MEGEDTNFKWKGKKKTCSKLMVSNHLKTSISSNLNNTRYVEGENQPLYWARSKVKLNPEEDGVLSFGMDEEKKLHPIKLDKNGQIFVLTRDLNSLNDGVLSYGQDKNKAVRPILTDYKGRIVLKAKRLNAKKDSIQIFGMDKEKKLQPIKLDKNGQVYVVTKKLNSLKDGVLSYGLDKKKKVHPILTDKNGRIALKAKRLNAQKDSIQIFGKDEQNKHKAILTDKQGRVQVQTTKFVSIKKTIITKKCWCGASSFDVSLYKVYSFAIINLTDNPAEVILQISPNNEDFFIDLPTRAIPGGETIVLVPKRFLQFAQLVFRTKDKCKDTKLQVFLQAQY
ncbi:DUF6385 domain-containing protein [Bacillus sp. FJAT-45350]|uniref:DUF6385 domain-containing protein n=1 Tax=Bacillus sp. FJAT-45350 TaxID=2011014 RepID=UPI000BB790A3|nr:DUF6385 domain-containing protein [Bacillus sp. FJAT-45350]